MMKKIFPRVIATNIFGTVGYLLTAFTWVLVASFIILFLADSDASITLPEDAASTLFMRHLQTPEFMIGISYVTTVVMVLIALLTFITFPYLIGSWSARGVRQALRLFKVPLTLRHLFFAKCTAAVLPLVGFLLYQIIMQPEEMLFSVLYITIVIVAIIALLCFTVQLFLARYLRIELKSVW